MRVCVCVCPKTDTEILDFPSSVALYIEGLSSPQFLFASCISEAKSYAICADWNNAQVKLPKKSKYRQRAHCNPLQDVHVDVPIGPDDVNWYVENGFVGMEST